MRNRFGIRQLFRMGDSPLQARRTLALTLALLLVLSMFTGWGVPAMATNDDSGRHGHPNGGNSGNAVTSIDVKITAAGSCSSEYDWSIEKTADPGTILLAKDETATINYTLNVTRTKVLKASVSGIITVKNDVENTTTGLRVEPQVYKGNGQNLQPVDQEPAEVDPEPSQIGPGDTETFHFTIDFTPEENSNVYTVVANVSITNHPNSVGTPYTTPEKESFTLDCSTSEPEDAEANITDSLDCPTGFECTPSSAGPWHVNDSTTTTHSIVVKNVSADCGESFELKNTATIEGHDSSEAIVTINTPACPSNDDDNNSPGDNDGDDDGNDGDDNDGDDDGNNDAPGGGSNPPGGGTNPPGGGTTPPGGGTTPPGGGITITPPTENNPTVVEGEKTDPAADDTAVTATTTESERTVLPFTGVDDRALILALISLVVGCLMYIGSYTRFARK